jgi:general secretion pathway protein A
MKDQKVFPPDVLAEIHRRTEGIPRLINSVCDNMLLTAFALESRQTNLEMLDEVSRDLHLSWPGSSRFWTGTENGALHEPRV